MTEISGYCMSCGTGWQAGQRYCGRCGTVLDVAGEPAATSGSPVSGSGSAGAGAVSAGPAAAGQGGSQGAVSGPADDAPYPREAVIGAVLLTIFLPFIALIAALLLRAQEIRSMRRDQLKNWAIASGAWLATGWVIGIVVVSSVMGSAGLSGCKGGIDQMVPPSYESSDGKHWVGIFTCMNGGTTTRPVPASQVPGGG